MMLYLAAMNSVSVTWNMSWTIACIPCTTSMQNFTCVKIHQWYSHEHQSLAILSTYGRPVWLYYVVDDRDRICPINLSGSDVTFPFHHLLGRRLVRRVDPTVGACIDIYGDFNNMRLMLMFDHIDVNHDLYRSLRIRCSAGWISIHRESGIPTFGCILDMEPAAVILLLDGELRAYTAQAWAFFGNLHLGEDVEKHVLSVNVDIFHASCDAELQRYQRVSHNANGEYRPLRRRSRLLRGRPISVPGRYALFGVWQHSRLQRACSIFCA